MTLPPVAPAVVADVLDALPPRLRKRVDTALDKAATWEVVADSDTCRAELDAETALTWTLRGGVLAAAEDLACSCLLAPKCLHRGVAVAAAPVAEQSCTEPPRTEPTCAEPPCAEPTSAEPPADLDRQADPDEPAENDGRGVVAAEPAVAVRAGERAAAASLWQACASVLRAGAAGSGAVVRAEVLRAVHSARVAGLHRAATAGLRVAASLAACRAGDSSFDREVLAAELVDLMLLCHELRTAETATTVQRGTARREYRPIGSLRLYGLCTEAVVTTSGYGGVVTHLVDESGALWTVPAIMPGGLERVAAAAGGPVAIGESGLTHRGLGRGGLLLSGGTASPDHRLGAGKSVRAVAASGVAWDAPPLAALWARPLADQVSAAFDALTTPDTHRPADADLLFADGRVEGPVGHALRLATAHGTLDLVGEGENARENLRVLAAAGGLRLRVVARLHPDAPGTATALAVAGDLSLPSDLGGHVDLGLDRIQRSHVTGSATTRLAPRPTPADRVPLPVRPLANVLHRITLGGRAVAAVASTTSDTSALVGSGLTATAAVLSDLAAACRDRERDAFGRIVRDAGDDFPSAWLRAGVHVREFTRAVARNAWLEAVG